MAVIWTLGLVMLLGTVVMVGARYRGRSEASLARSEHLATAAESAIYLGILITLAPRINAAAVFPLSCTMPGGEQVNISVQPEAGKLDLNAGSGKSLTALFAGLSDNRSTGERIASAIMTARDPRSAETADPKAQIQIGFKSILELDRITGMTPELLRAALPLLTVRSGRKEPDPASAPDALRNMLGLVSIGSTAAQVDTELTIDADITDTKGGRFVRQALVSLRAENGRLFVIREWRRADLSTNDTNSRSRSSSPCLAVLAAEG